MGGAAGAILLVVLVVVFFLAATVAMPFVGKQNIVAGDSFVYEMTSSIEGIDSKLFVVVTAVNSSSLNYSYVFSGETEDTDTDTADLSYSGNVLNVNFGIGYPLFLTRDDLEDMGIGNQSYWFALVGMTPMLVEKYTLTEGNYSLTVMLKAGTNLVVYIEESGDGEWIKVALLDASMLWAKVF